MNNLFQFQLDMEVPESARSTNIHLLHPDIVKGFTDRKCDTLGVIFTNSRFVYAKQLNGMYTRVSVGDY